jgi:hypothetical protein
MIQIPASVHRIGEFQSRCELVNIAGFDDRDSVDVGRKEGRQIREACVLCADAVAARPERFQIDQPETLDKGGHHEDMARRKQVVQLGSRLTWEYPDIPAGQPCDAHVEVRRHDRQFGID